MRPALRLLPWAGTLALRWIVLLGILLPAWSQEVVEVQYPGGELQERYEVNAEGQKHGTYERFRPDGSLEHQGRYRVDQLDGQWTEYGPQGERTLLAHYSRGQLHGVWKKFSDNQVVESARYSKGLLDGRWESFDPNGKRLVQAHYKKGLLHGKFVETRPDSGWERKAQYRDGQLDGKAKILKGRKVLSERVWKMGQLIEIDGRLAFPMSLPELAEELREATQTPESDPDDPLSKQRWGEWARLRAYRAVCRLPWRGIQLHAEWNELCDAAGELCKAIGRLDHTPEQPDGMSDEAYARGYQGTSSSNLCTGGLVGSVDQYMDDSDSSNIDRVGHRRWCLNPQMGKVGFGAAGQYAAMWAMDSSGTGSVKLDAIHYPPAGYCPVDMWGPRHAWSIQLLKAKVPNRAEDVTISIHALDEHFQEQGDPLELDYQAIGGGGYGGSDCLIFRPVALSLKVGARYRVRVRLGKGEAVDFDYLVEFCPSVQDLTQAGPAK